MNRETRRRNIKQFQRHPDFEDRQAAIAFLLKQGIRGVEKNGLQMDLESVELSDLRDFIRYNFGIKFK